MDDYIVIPQFIARLELTASERIALSLVYGFSRNDKGVFYGSYDYIAKWLGCTERSARNTMKSLEDKGYIEKGKIVKSGELLNYWGVKNFHSIEKFSTNNNIDIVDNNINTTSSIYKSLSKERIKKEIPLPYSSPKFLETWGLLLDQPKWKGKSNTALRKCAELLAKYTEDVALQMMDNTIMNGWQGLFPLRQNTPQRAANTAASLASSRESFQRIADRRTTAEQEAKYLEGYDN